MKKTTIILTLLVVFALIAVSVYFCIEFFVLYRGASEPNELPQTSKAATDLEAFVLEKWDVESTDYDGQCLTLYRSYPLSYAQACELGGNIFTGELTPESYLPFAATVAADVSSQFGPPVPIVVLAYRSEDGEVIFSADSEGNIFTCWNT